MPWIKDMSNEDYHHGDELKDFYSSSNIRDFMRSPLHCRWNKDNPTKETPAMHFGTIFHALALEPDTVVEIPEINLFRKDGRHDRKGEAAALEAFSNKNQGKVLATKSELIQATAMVESIKNHRFAGPLLLAPGDCELSGTFKDPTYAIPGKIRVDKIIREDQILIDLKSTVDASEEAFAKSIYNYGYDVQGAWYNLGCFEIEKKSFEFLIVAVEKEPPHGCNVFRLTEKHFEIAYSKIDEIMFPLSQCIEKDHWPSYPAKIHTPEVPAWESRKYWGHVRQN